MQRSPVASTNRLMWDYKDQWYLTTYITINGTHAYTLFDSGSTTDFLSLNFMWIAKLDVLELYSPVTLQLGCVGGGSKINYGIKVNTHFGPISYNNIYYDITNLSKYSTVLGAPFLRHHNIVLDFVSDEFVVAGKHRVNRRTWKTPSTARD